MIHSPPAAAPAPDERSRFPVVAIGASAGGLPALHTLLCTLPPKLQAALVIITHAAPDAKSHLAEILDQASPLPVRDITDRERLEPGVVAVLPAGYDLGIEAGRLRLLPRERAPVHRPIDRFFSALAHDQGQEAVAVILSGAGSDGSRGLRDIHAAGGLVLVQDPATAEHDGMPTSAIQTGLSDIVLPVEELGPYLTTTLPAIGQDPDTPPLASLDRVAAALRAHTGHDFSGYKPSTLLRRVHKRMLLSHTPQPADYIALLEGDPEERTRLFHDLLIGVTAFFRDPPAFEALARALPSLLTSRTGADVRCWVAGCSTGEEAYSVGILLDEQTRDLTPRRTIKIFATDIDPLALETARKGSYSVCAATEITPKRLREHFRCNTTSCTVLPRLREDIVFARHDLVRDPPFLGMDLVVCRNFLIYLTPELQAKVLSVFVHALQPGGLLLLGSSETLGPHTGMFDVVNKKWRLFRRKTTPASLPPDLPARFARMAPAELDPPWQRSASERPDPEGLAESLLLRRYAPAAVLLDAEGNVLRLSGETRPFLKLPEGTPTLSIHRLAHKILRPRLRSAMQAALADGREQSSGPLQLEATDPTRINLRVIPLPGPHGNTPFLLVVFEKIDNLADTPPVPSQESLTHDALISRYETELEQANEQLQRAVEGYETLNEELRASNEELLSMNEELQSSNEEMDASREELQSLNEELTTLNAELQAKISALDRSQAFVENLLTATNLATLVLDQALHIVRFTPAALRLFHLVATDQSRPLEQIKTTFAADFLLDDCRWVLGGGDILEREIHTPTDDWFLQRAYPYRDPAGAVDGVVLTFTEVTELKRAEEVLARGKQELEVLVASRTEELAEKVRLLDMANVVIRDMQAHITLWNTGAEQLYGYTREEALGKISYRLLRTIFPEPYERILDSLLEQGRWTGELRKFAKDGREIQVATVWVLNRDTAGHPTSILEVGTDITERNRLELQARRWSRVFESADFGLAHASAIDNTFVEVNPAFARQRGYTPAELAGTSLFRIYPPELREQVRETIAAIDVTGHGVFESKHIRKDGSQFPVLMEVTVLREQDGQAFSRVAYALDITERIKTEETIRDMARFPSENPHPVLRVGHDNRVSHTNKASDAFLAALDSGLGLPFPAKFMPYLEGALTRNVITDFEVEVAGRIIALSACPIIERGYVNLYGMDVTERRQAEQALADSEEQFHSLFTSMGEGVCVMEAVRDATGDLIDYLFLDVNPSYEQLVDAAREHIVGRRITEIFGLKTPPDKETYARILKTTQAETFETFFKPQRKYLRISAFSPQPERFAAIIEDVTERKRAEEALRKSEERLRQLVDAAPDAIIIQSKGRFAYVNPAATRLFGYDTVDGLLGEPIIEHIHPDDRQRIRQRIQDANERRLFLPPIPVLYLRKDGSPVTVEAVAAPFEFQGISGSLVFARDITERLQAEEEKRRSTILQMAVARVRDAYIANQPSETIFETALTEILSLTESQYGFIAELLQDEQGRPYQQCLAISNIAWDAETQAFYEANAPHGMIFTAMDGLNAAAVVTQKPIISADPPHDFRSNGRLPEGHPHLETFLGVPLFHGRQCVGSIGLANRATGYDQTLLDYARPLFDACAQIIERLRAEQRLVAAKQAAEAASLAKSEFLANMSHEIRTPLNGMLGMLQLMQTTTLDKEQTEYVDHTITSCKRLTRLLSDILDLSLVESGRLSIRVAPCSPADLRDAVTDLFTLPAKDKGIRLSVTLDPDLPETILADEARLRQILFNLVGNAVKFTDQGAVTAFIGPASRRYADTARLLIMVTDTGIGIPESQIDAIFEPFGQVEGVYVRRFGGAGLGLSIVRRLVRLMGGTITVDSVEGEGTTMAISLPLVPLPKSHPSPPPSVTRDNLRPGLRLLLAEDDAVSRLSFRRMLEKAGHQVTVAENGSQALALLLQHDYDCILMDIQMPIMDGVAATRAIRTDPGFRHKAGIPIIAMTAYAMDGDRETFMKAGMDGYAGKPVDMDELQGTIRQVLADKPISS